MAASAKGGNPLVDYIGRQLQLNSPADVVYEIFRGNCEIFQRLMPEKIQKVEPLKHDGNSVGSTRRWTFVDGKCGIWKDYVEAIDEEKKSITWTLLDGPVPKNSYKSLKVKFEFFLKCEVSWAHVTLTFEKNDATVPVPSDYLDFICEMVGAAANNPLTQ